MSPGVLPEPRKQQRQVARWPGAEGREDVFRGRLGRQRRHHSGCEQHERSADLQRAAARQKRPVAEHDDESGNRGGNAEREHDQALALERASEIDGEIRQDDAVGDDRRLQPKDRQRGTENGAERDRQTVEDPRHESAAVGRDRLPPSILISPARRAFN